MSQATIGELLRRHRLEATLTQTELGQRLGYDHSSLSRMERNAYKPTADFVHHFCTILALSGTQRDELLATLQLVNNEPADFTRTHPRIAWGAAPEEGQFYNREAEQQLLGQILTNSDCRLLTIWGMGGIGKTSLTVKLIKTHQKQFDYIFWQSLSNVPALRETVISLLSFISDTHAENLTDPSEKLAIQLIALLRQKRCLLVFDNFESVLQAKDEAGWGYEQLVEQIGRSQHRSLLLLTSRQKPSIVGLLEGESGRVVAYKVGGLDVVASRQLLEHKGLAITADSATTHLTHALTSRCSGNPLALEIIAQVIRDVYTADIAAFLTEVTLPFGRIQTILQQQFEWLSPLGQQIMLWLAIKREPMARDVFRLLLLPPVSAQQVALTLNHLLQRSLVEKTAIGFFQLQNVILEFVTNHFVTIVAKEIVAQQLDWFGQFPILEATAKRYVQQAQRHFLVLPLLEQLLYELGSKTAVFDYLQTLLPLIRQDATLRQGFAAGNILNLLVVLSPDLSQCDFSQLAIRQTSLQADSLAGVDFTQADFQDCTFAAPFGHILAIQFAPNGAQFATTTAAGKLHFWQTETARLQGTRTIGNDWVRALAFFPDGKRMVVSDGKGLQIWDGVVGQRLAFLRGHDKQIRSIAVSPDGSLIASSGEDQTVRLWDGETGDVTGALRKHEGAVWSVAFAPQPQLGITSLLASGGMDNTIRLWDGERGLLQKTLQGHTNRVTTVAFSPSGELLASGSHDATVRIWDMVTQTCRHVLHNHAGWVRTAVFSPNGRYLASSCDELICLWEVAPGKLLRILQGHERLVESLAFSPDGHQLVSGGADLTLRVWDVATGDCLTVLAGYHNPMWTAVFHPKNGRLLAGSSDGKIRQWEPNSDHCLHTWRGHGDWVKGIAINAAGTLLASGSSDKTVRLWDLDSGQCQATLQGHEAWVSSVAFHPTYPLLASGSGDKTVRVWETAVFADNPKHILRGHQSRVWAVAFCPTTHLLASSDDSGDIWLWDVVAGQQQKMFTAHEAAIYALAFVRLEGQTASSQSVSRLLSGGNDHILQMWDIEAGVCVASWLQTATIWHLAAHPKRPIVALSLNDWRVKLVDVHTGRVEQVFTGHEKPVWWSAFSPDGKLLVSCSDDLTCRIWEVASGNCLQIFQASKPYEQMKVTGATGLTRQQKESLAALGATI